MNDEIITNSSKEDKADIRTISALSTYEVKERIRNVKILCKKDSSITDCISIDFLFFFWDHLFCTRRCFFHVHYSGYDR